MTHVRMVLGLCCAAFLCACATSQPLTVAEDSAAGKSLLSEFAAMDSDGDGNVTLDQSTQYHEALFTQSDTNRDGFLEASELPLVMIPANSSPEAVVARFDRDRNKKLSSREFLVRVNTLYSRDQNGDGTLTRDEFLSAPRAAPEISASSSGPSDAPDTTGKQGNRGKQR